MASEVVFFFKCLRVIKKDRPISNRRRPLYTTTTQILNLSDLLKGGNMKRTSRRTMLLKGDDMKRISRETALLEGKNTRTIQLPLKHLKGVSTGMTPLSDWLNVLPRGRGTAGVTELPLPPKGMLWHIVLINIKKLCMQHLYSIVGRPYYRVWSGLSPYYLTKRGSRAHPTMYRHGSAQNHSLHM